MQHICFTAKHVTNFLERSTSSTSRYSIAVDTVEHPLGNSLTRVWILSERLVRLKCRYGHTWSSKMIPFAFAYTSTLPLLTSDEIPFTAMKH